MGAKRRCYRRRVGQPDQFAKRTFAQETPALTHGAMAWSDPPEISLTKVQGDGRLVVRDPALLPPLDPPWTEVRGHDEIQVEIKMAGDHLDLPAIERILLRRHARQIERVEDPDAPFLGQLPIWAVAPHASDALRATWKLRRVAPGCYRVGPSWFPFLWIAANELPLRDDLVPFLVARSGRALDDFATWVASRRSIDWVLDMVQFTAMSTRARAQVIQSVETDDPEVRARQRHLVELLVAQQPDMMRQILAARPDLMQQMLATRPELEREIENKGRVLQARSALRRVLTGRGLPLRAEDDARIEACTAIATLRRWLDNAIVATSAAEALRSRRRA